MGKSFGSYSDSTFFPCVFRIRFCENACRKFVCLFMENALDGILFDKSFYRHCIACFSLCEKRTSCQSNFFTLFLYGVFLFSNGFLLLFEQRICSAVAGFAYASGRYSHNIFCRSPFPQTLILALSQKAIFPHSCCRSEILPNPRKHKRIQLVCIRGESPLCAEIIFQNLQEVLRFLPTRCHRFRERGLGTA